MWNQWGAQPPGTPGFQAAAYPPAPAGSTTAAPPPGGFPMSYPFYPTSAMPPTAAAMPGYTAAQQWSMPQQQQWQQWEQWQQQYSQWQQQYGDKYQAQMMMGGGAGIPPLPAQGDVAVNPPLPTDMKDQQQIQAKDADNYGNNTTYSQGGMQVSDLPNKRPHESSTEDTSSPQQANKKARESQEEPSDAEKAFDTQFKNWEEQFLKWKEQNSNHPDKNQYKEYEAKWESWREQLMQRREQMRKKRETKLADDSKLSSLNEAPPSISEPKPSPSIPPLSTNIQKPMPPVSIPPMQNPNQNPIAMQGMGFPPFNNPPPMVQNSMVQSGMGFPNFGNQHYPSFPSQPPGYGMPPAPFQAQPMYPGMAGMNMMCPPPAIVNPNAPDLGSSTTISQLPPSKKDSAPTGNQGDKSQDNSNFLNKSEGNNKGIPGLDLVEGGASGRNSEDNHSQAPPKQLPPNAAPLHTSDDNTPFNFPPPQKQPQMGFSGSMGPGSGFSSGPGNMPFMGSQNFGPPPGFGSNMRGPFPGSFNQPLHNQPAQNKFGPNTTQGPPPQFGKNFQQQSRPFFDQDNSQHAGFKDNSQHGGFKDNSQQGGFKDNSQHGGFKDNSQHGGFKDNNQHGGFKDNSQHGGFNPQQPGIPNLMDGFDPSKGPPSFQKNFGGNQDENDFQDEDEYRDQGEDEYNEYDEYDGSRFENPWDKEQEYEDENNDDNFKEPPDFNKPFGNRSDGPNNFNKPNDRFGSKSDVPYGGGFNRGNVNDRFSDTQVPKDRFSSQEPDNKFLRGPGNKFDRFPESRGPEGNVKDMDDKSSRFSGPQGGDGPGPGGKGFGGRENKVSRFDAPLEERRFGGSRFGPAGEDSPHDQDLDSEGSRDKKPGFDKMNEPGDRFGRGKFPNQNKGSRDKFDNSDNRYSGPGERFGGPGNKFGGSDDRFGGQGGFDGPRGSGGFDGPRGGPGGFDGPRGGPGGFDAQRGGPGGFDGPRGGPGGFDGQRGGPGGFNGSRGGRFNGPDSRFPPGGRGARDFDSPGRFENDGPGFGGERFGGRKDKPFGRDEDKGEPGNQGRLKGLLPHPTMDRDKIPSLMSLAKPPLLPLPGRQGAPITMDEQDDDFPSGKPDLDDRRQEGQGGAPIGRRNEPIPPKEGNSGKTLPPFPHELKTAWEQSTSVNATPVGPGTSVIDYDHKPIDGQIVIEDLNEPESLEPIQVFDYNHGANPGPHMPHQRRDILEEGGNYDWRNNSDRGPRNRDRGRDDRDRLGPRGRGNWEDDRNRPKERGDRSDDRPRDRDWGSGKRNERDDKRDRDRNDRDRSDRDRDDKRDRDRNDRDRGDKDKNERDRDRNDKDRDRSDKDRDRNDRDRSDRRDSRRDEKDNKENRSSAQADRRGGTRDRNQHDKTKDDNKSKDDNKYSSKNDKSSSKEGNGSQKQPDQKSQQSPAVLIEDILNNPGRNNRPGKIVVILRGPPGSGKTFVAKLIKDKEVEMGGSAPRILSLDDYFMVEIEKEETDVESGKTVKNKIMEYEYESGMESSYRHSLIKALRKTILDGYFPFIIIDCVHEKLQHYEEINTFAKQKGFQVYICEMDKDLSSCSKRNIHKRTEKEIEDIIKNWEPTPSSQTILDVRSLLQSAAITEVDMEDTTEEATTDEKKDEENKKADEEGKTAEKSGEEKDKKAEPEGDRALFTSKWDTMEFSGEKLDRLDGLGKARKTSDTIRDWLQLPEDYYELSGSNAPARSGKRVRWADLEERRQQEKMRAIGFVVGQTDWSRMMDPSFGGDKLAQTKYI